MFWYTGHVGNLSFGLVSAIEAPFMQLTPRGSGSHSPLFVQTVEFGPLSTYADRQLKLIEAPSVMGNLGPTDITEFMFDGGCSCCRGYPQVATLV